MQKIIVISGINLFAGGPLSIYLDFLSAIVDNGYDKQYRIIAFVHKKELFKKFFDSKIEFIELPKSRKSYLNRIFYEYIWFYWYSKKHNIYLWISLHDMTPNVVAKKRVVYCHNPLPFIKLTPRLIKRYPSTALMKYLYRYVYAINIRKNTQVIVQQDWMRQKFYKLFRLKNGSVAVARPTAPTTITEKIESKEKSEEERTDKIFTFVYAAYPRFFKNYEVIAKAADLLRKHCVVNFKVVFTINGSENQYAKELYQSYSNISNIEWRGLMTREKVFELYSKADALIFPSILETWGLPISEFRDTGKLIIASDLPYAYEAVQPYDNVVFFDPNDESMLATIMEEAIMKIVKVTDVEERRYEEPCYKEWSELIDNLFAEGGKLEKHVKI